MCSSNPTSPRTRIETVDLVGAALIVLAALVVAILDAVGVDS